MPGTASYSSPCLPCLFVSLSRGPLPTLITAFNTFNSFISTIFAPAPGSIFLRSILTFSLFFLELFRFCISLSTIAMPEFYFSDLAVLPVALSFGLRPSFGFFHWNVSSSASLLFRAESIHNFEQGWPSPSAVCAMSSDTTLVFPRLDAEIYS